MKHSLQRSTEDAPSGHFFASSVGEWRTDTNLDGLIGCMKRNKLPFNLFYIPLPPDAEYQARVLGITG